MAAPECGGTAGYLNLRGDHFFLCDDHMAVRCVGSNLFSDWREESSDIWEGNKIKLAEYREVKPIYVLNYKTDAPLVDHSWYSEHDQWLRALKRAIWWQDFKYEMKRKAERLRDSIGL